MDTFQKLTVANLLVRHSSLDNITVSGETTSQNLFERGKLVIVSYDNYSLEIN